MCNSGSGSAVYELIRSARVGVKVFVTLLFLEWPEIDFFKKQKQAECFWMHLSNIITCVSLDSIFLNFIAGCYVCSACHIVLAPVLGKKVRKMNENRLNPDILLMLSLALSIIAWILSIIQQPSFSDLFWETWPVDYMCDPWEPESLSLKAFSCLLKWLETLMWAMITYPSPLKLLYK